MWPAVIPAVLAGLLCAFLGCAVSADSETPVYGKLGGEVVLKPGAAFVANSTKSIVWKDGKNIAIEWDGTEIIRFRHFEERGSLNNLTGEMTLTGLIETDSGLYTPEVNDVAGTPVTLVVISPVPKPTVTYERCGKNNTSCTLTCDGDTTGAEPVTYTWRLDGKEFIASSKERRITKEESLSIKEFSCVLENPVSQESSKRILNPFIPEEPKGRLNISNGVIVLITLLAAVLLIAIIHRIKAGMWFFQKESMPWEADFWSKPSRPRKAARSNGATSPQEKSLKDEESPMT